MISAVARIFEPGCKVDCCLLLEGKQGTLKSTALRELGYPWFTDEIAELGTKDASLQAAGVWLVELAELESFTRAEVSKVKSFMSRRVDRFRPPYGQRTIEQPRQCVFAGTTNANAYLKDETGARRFWPVEVGTIDTEALGRARDQLWAEAVKRYRAGDRWWLDTAELASAAAEAVADRYEGDPWEMLIANHVAGRKGTSVTEILRDAIEKEPSQWTRGDQMRVGRCLTALGWRRYRATHGTRDWLYAPPE